MRRLLQYSSPWSLSGNGDKSHHANVKAQKGMWIVLEHVGDDMRVATLHHFYRSRAHQRGGQQQIAAVFGDDGKAANLGNAMLTEEIFDVDLRVDELEAIVRMLLKRGIVQRAQHAHRASVHAR